MTALGWMSSSLVAGSAGVLTMYQAPSMSLIKAIDTFALFYNSPGRGRDVKDRAMVLDGCECRYVPSLPET
jgi:hypothetical protein